MRKSCKAAQGTELARGLAETGFDEESSMTEEPGESEQKPFLVNEVPAFRDRWPFPHKG